MLVLLTKTILEISERMFPHYAITAHTVLTHGIRTQCVLQFVFVSLFSQQFWGGWGTVGDHWAPLMERCSVSFVACWVIRLGRRGGIEGTCVALLGGVNDQV